MPPLPAQILPLNHLHASIAGVKVHAGSASQVVDLTIRDTCISECERFSDQEISVYDLFTTNVAAKKDEEDLDSSRPALSVKLDLRESIPTLMLVVDRGIDLVADLSIIDRFYGLFSKLQDPNNYKPATTTTIAPATTHAKPAIVATATSSTATPSPTTSTTATSTTPASLALATTEVVRVSVAVAVLSAEASRRKA